MMLKMGVLMEDNYSIKHVCLANKALAGAYSVLTGRARDLENIKGEDYSLSRVDLDDILGMLFMGVPEGMVRI